MNGSRERLITTLIHKFGANGPKEKLDARERRLRGERSAAVYLKELADKLPPGFKAKGDIFVFVDECHRTQGGVMNLAMKKIMGPDVMLIGFTGTPLLKSEKGALTSYANFGQIRRGGRRWRRA